MAHFFRISEDKICGRRASYPFAYMTSMCNKEFAHTRDIFGNFHIGGGMGSTVVTF